MGYPQAAFETGGAGGAGTVPYQTPGEGEGSVACPAPRGHSNPQRPYCRKGAALDARAANLRAKHSAERRPPLVPQRFALNQERLPPPIGYAVLISTSSTTSVGGWSASSSRTPRTRSVRSAVQRDLVAVPPVKRRAPIVGRVG